MKQVQEKKGKYRKEKGRNGNSKHTKKVIEIKI